MGEHFRGESGVGNSLRRSVGSVSHLVVEKSWNSGQGQGRGRGGVS